MTSKEINEAVTRLYTAVIAQGVRDLSSEDELVKQSAKKFFEQKQCMPTTATQSFFDTTKRLLNKHKNDPDVEERIKTFKKLSQASVEVK